MKNKVDKKINVVKAIRKKIATTPERVSAGVAIDPISGKLRSLSDMEFADMIVVERRNLDKWQIIELLMERWFHSDPKEAQGTLHDVKYMRETSRDKRFGTTKDKNLERRMTMLFPITLQKLIRSVYKAEELLFDKKFFREFLKRYPGFQVPEEL